MKRFPGESILEYRQRRREEKAALKMHLMGTIITTGTYRKKPAPEKTDRPKPISPAVGKRHKGESLAEFRQRRMTANARRRQRETARRNEENHQDPD